MTWDRGPRDSTARRAAGGGGRHSADRSARDYAADRSLRDDGVVACASQLRDALRSGGEGTRGIHDAIGAEPVFAER